MGWFVLLQMRYFKFKDHSLYVSETHIRRNAANKQGFSCMSDVANVAVNYIYSSLAMYKQDIILHN